MTAVNAADQRVSELLYIMGTGRSGSTVLEILLGNAPDTFGAGELFNVLEDGYLGDAECSCGKLFSACDVWSEMKSDVPLDDSEVEKLAVECREIEWHKGFWWRWLGWRRPSTRYEYFNNEIFKSLSRISGAARIIDSSKYVGRALALYNLFGERFHVIWLVRDAAGILHSLQKPNKDEQLPKSLFSSTLYIIFVTLCAWLAKRQLGNRCLIVQYGNLMRDPAGELARIAEWSSINLDDVIRRIENMEEFEIGHLVTGNRLRKRGKLKLDTYYRHLVTGGSRRYLVLVLNWWYRILGIHEPRV